MNSPHAYDKANYHCEAVAHYGLSEKHAANHTVVFLRWLIERQMMSAFFENESAAILELYHAGDVSIHEVYSWWDCCLISDMLSDDGNAFAMHYFDFDVGSYLDDYKKALQGDLPSEYHVDYSEENYQLMRQVIDRRYDARKTRKKRWWRS